MKRRNLDQINEEAGRVASFVRLQRKALGYTQIEFCKRVGVGLRFLKELELGKKSLRMDKVEQVLQYFGYELAPIKMKKAGSDDA